MKLFYVGPNLDVKTMSAAVIKDRSLRAVEPIADLILGYFKADGYAALVGLSCLNAGEVQEGLPRPPYPPLALNQERFSRYVVTRFKSECEVRAAILRMGDCYGDLSATSGSDIFSIRSIISCRAVNYGYDGQAFLCLHAEDPAPTTPNTDLIIVEERPDLLLQTDYADGVAALEDW